MEQALVRLIDRAHPLVINLGLVVILLAIVWGAVRWAKATERLWEIFGREGRLVELVTKLQAEEQHRIEMEVTARQLRSALLHLQTYLEDFRRAKESEDMRLNFNLQILLSRVVEGLPLEVKLVSGEDHRSGLWLLSPDQHSLILFYGSAGFPPDYVFNRTLSVNESIAGRSVRKRTVEVVEDVFKDPDYSPPQSKHDYRSLICIPVFYKGKVIAVMTVDGKHPFADVQVDICRTYAAVAELILGEYIDALQQQQIGTGGVAS